MGRINVTKAFLPPIEEYQDYIAQIWENDQLTNQGPLLVKLQDQLKQYLGVRNIHFVSNGTTALQLALRAINVTEGEVITTPFSYVATTAAIMWEKFSPVFVDIRADTFCMDPQKIEAAITPRTKVIMPVHVFGNPCDVEAIAQIAKKHNLKVIYDAAHAFGVEYKGQSLMRYGDISTSSFHATKLFHTGEGGAVIADDDEISRKVELLKRFGHNGDEHYMLGMNAKANELQAAMGLTNLPYVNGIIEARKQVFSWYDRELNVKRPDSDDIKLNYAYYPWLFKSEQQLLKKMKEFSDKNIFPRRYFYPSLNKLPYLGSAQQCVISEDIAGRIVCLPLYPGLSEAEVKEITAVIKG